MKMTTLSSGSHGNGYLIHNDAECLIIECAVDIKQVMKAIDFKVEIVSGCIATHAHLDHSGKIQQYAQKGIKVYSHKDTFRGFKHHNFVEVDTQRNFQVGNFKIRAFEVEHDVKNYGYLIDHPETGRFCFITDATTAPFQFPNLNHILIEANYDKEIIDTNDTSYFVRDRVVNSHLSFDSCLEFLSLQNIENVNNIVLLHASDSNSDILTFRDKVESMYGINTLIAEKGLEIDLNLEPF